MTPSCIPPMPARGRRRDRRPGLAILAMAALWMPLAAVAVEVTDPGQGVVALSSGSTAAAELSGITWLGGTSYLAVGDNGAKALWQVSIAVDGATGRITSSGVTGSIAAPSLGSDSEGIAYRSTTDSVFVADEVASSIQAFSATSGGFESGVAVPAIYAPPNVQDNRGLEALAWNQGRLWTANEETLLPDGPISTTSGGSLVRIQRFDAALGADGQWAYLTDPITAMSPFTTAERSGVVDILPWSDTRLLVLEREFGGVVPTFRSRLYAVDVAGAPDVSGVASLSGSGVSPLSKSLLWERSFATSNFEGMTWGPAVAGGRSLLLVSDNGGGISQSLYPLIVVPEPAPWIPIAVGAGLAWPWVRRSAARVHRRTPPADAA